MACAAKRLDTSTHGSVDRALSESAFSRRMPRSQSPHDIGGFRTPGSRAGHYRRDARSLSCGACALQGESCPVSSLPLPPPPQHAHARLHRVPVSPPRARFQSRGGAFFSAVGPLRRCSRWFGGGQARAHPGRSRCPPRLPRGAPCRCAPPSKPCSPCARAVAWSSRNTSASPASCSAATARRASSTARAAASVASARHSGLPRPFLPSGHSQR